MSVYDTSAARPFGAGQRTPLGALSDPDLVALLSQYKRGVAGRYRSVLGEEIETGLPPGPMYVSPKVDGELWYLVLDGGEATLVSPRGRVIFGDVPVLAEARDMASRAQGQTVLAGELLAFRKEGRARVGDLGKAKGGEADAEVKRIGFMAFDLLRGGDADGQAPLTDYLDRLAVVRRLTEGGKRVQAIKTEVVNSPAEVARLFAEWVDGSKAEGVVARAADGRIYKIKPSFNVDAAVVGYTYRTEDAEQARSLLLAVMREDGHFQIIGSVGNLGSEDNRRAVLARLRGTEVDSSYSRASSSGALYRFIRPETVVEVRMTDIQSEDASGRPIDRMVLEIGEGGWRAVRKMASVGLIHPVLQRVRDDKSVNAIDVRADQVLERTYIADLAAPVDAATLPTSAVLRREVYTKAAKGAIAVRKLLVWQTNKHDVDPSYPAFVVHWTDYSPGRGAPLKRTVRPAPTEAIAAEIADGMIAAQIKRGWERIGP